MANIIYESNRGFEAIPIEDDFLKNRELFLIGGVDGASSGEMIKKLLYLEKESKTEEIVIYINSPGGSVQDGLAVYDTIMMMEAPVRTVCIGTCASMGAILFLAGERRQMMRHGKIMIHDPAFGGRHEMGGKKPHEIQAELDDLNRCREALAVIISERTGKSMDEIYEVTANDTYYNADEAVAFGLANEIITKKGGC